jgi:hypothetical protein
LEIDNLGRVGDYHTNICSSGTVVMQSWWLLLIELDTCCQILLPLFL